MSSDTYRYGEEMEISSDGGEVVVTVSEGEGEVEILRLNPDTAKRFSRALLRVANSTMFAT